MKKLITLMLAFTMVFSLSTSVFTSKAEAASSREKANAIVAYAKKIDPKVSYKWGARDEKRMIFDCSSFTQFVYKSQGVYIPWGANAQTKYGTSIYSKSSLKPGDLVMLSLKSNSKNIGHVGIYIGGGKFIHNLNPASDVVISDLNSGYWKTRFVKGTRVLK